MRVPQRLERSLPDDCHQQAWRGQRTWPLDAALTRSPPDSGVTMTIPTQMSLVGFIASAPELHFTKAGARKAAHFVDLVIRRIIEAAPQSNVIALPVAPETGAPTAPELQPGGVERLIDQMAAGVPTIGLPPALQARPLAGPIQPLTGQAAPSEQPLLASIAEARGRGDAATQLERVFGQGIAPCSIFPAKRLPTTMSAFSSRRIRTKSPSISAGYVPSALSMTMNSPLASRNPRRYALP